MKIAFTARAFMKCKNMLMNGDDTSQYTGGCTKLSQYLSKSTHKKTKIDTKRFAPLC